MQFNALLVFFCATGAMAAPRILGCRMTNGALNPSPNICTAAGGKVAGTVRTHSQPSPRGSEHILTEMTQGKCCTSGADGEVVTEARFISGCNNNGGSVGPSEVFGGC